MKRKFIGFILCCLPIVTFLACGKVESNKVESVVSKNDDTTSSTNDNYLTLLKPYEEFFSIEDGVNKSCDLVLNVNGFLYCYSFSEAAEITDFTYHEWTLIFDEENLTDYEYSNGIYAYMKVGINNGEIDFWLGRIYTNTQGATDTQRNLSFGYEDDAKDLNKIVLDSDGKFQAGYINKYDETNHSIDIQFGDTVDHDTYISIENISNAVKTLNLSDDAEITVWSLSFTGEVFITLDTFEYLIKNGYFDSTPCTFKLNNDDEVVGIYEILNP